MTGKFLWSILGRREKAPKCLGAGDLSAMKGRDYIRRSMNLHTIGDIDDPRLDAYRSLKQTNDTRWQRQFVVEGDKLARRLLASSYEIVSVLLGERQRAEFEPLVPPESPIYVVPDALIERLIGFNFHRGVLACGRRPAPRPVETLVGRDRRQSTLIVCPDTHDPENLGSLLRLAHAFGVDGAVLGPECADYLSRRVLRVSMGAALQTPVAVSSDLKADLVRLQTELGFELVATVTDRDAEPLGGFRRADRTAILLGSEAHGLQEPWRRLCGQRVTIPMPSDCDSLNVAVAAGIVLYEVCVRG